ncbi:MAG TPA: ribosome biogenesis GTP-binding protein YihA/YsxC [Syntrophomonadaceae bacterium]|nr:ribosome biogenesis GTP-binding protein YihA/YsxC [Syntrophomonadaceae bacterium]
MIIKQAEYSGTYVNLESLPVDQKLEVALVGRSNVGKSSLINKLVNRRGLAKSSSTPGKTRTINYYQINQSWYMVDLPGYGYARVSKKEKDRWGQMVDRYLEQRGQLRGVLMLLDIRHEPNRNDVIMKEWLEHKEIPFLLVATKADKISRGARSKQLALIRRTLDLKEQDIPVCFSAQTGEGVEELKQMLQELLDSEEQIKEDS